jgi:DNA-binding Lrp family transcriptional regulator
MDIIRRGIMPDDLDILKIVADNPQISQRRIAESTGISLGQVNFLIKKLVKKGLIKIEGQTPKSIKYNLTPKGMVEKASLTLEYIRISYKAVISLTDTIRKIADRQGGLYIR